MLIVIVVGWLHWCAAKLFAQRLAAPRAGTYSVAPHHVFGSDIVGTANSNVCARARWCSCCPVNNIKEVLGSCAFSRIVCRRVSKQVSGSVRRL